MPRACHTALVSHSFPDFIYEIIVSGGLLEKETPSGCNQVCITPSASTIVSRAIKYITTLLEQLCTTAETYAGVTASPHFDTYTFLSGEVLGVSMHLSALVVHNRRSPTLAAVYIMSCILTALKDTEIASQLRVGVAQHDQHLLCMEFV